MPDWRAFVRARLRVPGLTPERESHVVRELAAQLDDFYRDARARGLDAGAAEAHAAAQITDWTRFSRDVRRADRPHVQPGVDRLIAAVEAGPSRRHGGLLMFAHALRDARYAVRQLIKAPGFTSVAILTLALGTGATTAIFSVVNGVLLRPLPYPDAAALVRIHEIVPQAGRFSVAPANFLDWRAQNHVFERMAAYGTTSGTFTSTSGPERVPGATVSWDMFQLLRVSPLLGSGFTSGQDTPGAPATIVLSHTAWQQRFSGDPGIIGRSIPLNGVPTTVAGVMPKDFYFPTREVQFWQPLALPAAGASRGAHFLAVLARTKDGVPLERADAEMRGLAERLALQYPSNSANESAVVVSLQDQIVGRIRPALLTLAGAVAVVVLIACANVANLLLVRASVREREIAVRAALGASRARIVVQMIAESLVLSVAGGGLGLVLAYAAIGPIQTLGAGSIPRVGDIAIDARVLAFAALASIVTGFLFGLAPAWHASRPSLGAMLKEGGRSASASGGRWLRQTLLVVEVALSVVLLIGAALLLRSFAKVTGVDPGFDPDRVLAFQVSLPGRTYPDSAKFGVFYDGLLEKLHAQPGVLSAGFVQTLPMRGGYSLSFEVRGRPKPRDGEGPSANYRSVSADYLQTLGVRLLRGRPFGAADTATGRMVALVDETFAKKYFPDEDAIGQGIDIGNGTNGFYDIVGVVGDVHNDGLDSAPDPTMYVPFKTDSFSTVWVVLRGPGDPSRLAGPARQAVREMDPALPAYSMSPLSTIVSDSVAQRRFSMLLLAVFAAVALFLAAVGLYGVVSYTVSQRTREIGLRMAIGATPPGVLRLVVGGGMTLAALGVAVGLAGAAALARLVRTLLFEVAPFDPASYVLTALLLLMVAALACVIPARRAMQVDPIVAMQAD